MSSNEESVIPQDAGSLGGPDLPELKKMEERELSNSDLGANPASSGWKSGGTEQNASDRRERGEKGSPVKERILRSDAAKQRDGKTATASGSGVEFEGRRVLRSYVAKRRKEADAGLIVNVSATCRSDFPGSEECKEEILRSGVSEEREVRSVSMKGEPGRTREKVRVEAGNNKWERKRGATETINGIREQINSEEEIALEKETSNMSVVGSQGQESSVDVKEVAQEVESNGPKIVKEDATGSGHQKIGKKKKKIYDKVKGEKRTARSRNPVQKEEADANEMKVTGDSESHQELMKCEEESKVEKRTTRLDVAKRKENVDIVPEVVSESGMRRKRNGEACASETSMKKLKVESLRSRQDQERKNDGFQEISELRGKNVKLAKYPDQRTVGMLKGNDIAYRKSTQMLGQGAVKALSRNKKVVGFDKSNFRKEDEANRESLQTQDQNKYSSLSLRRRRRNLKGSSSNVSFGESHLNMKKTCSTEKITHGAKNRRKLNYVDTSNVKNEVAVKRERGSTSEISFSTRQIQETERLARSIAKKKLRDQIKDILLNAGWTIDLRPRAGKCYDDSVYISPQGSSYWSIIKAYNVFQTQMNCTHGEKDEHLSSMSRKKSKMSDQSIVCTGSAFSLVPTEALSILKKVMVNKRRTKAELEEAKKNLTGGEQNKKTKLGTGIKHPKNKNLNHSDRKAKERTKKTNIVASSNKSIVGYTSKKAHERNREKQRGMILLARGCNKQTENSTGDYVPYFGKRTIFSWMIDLGTMPASGKLKYMNQNKTHSMLGGWITRNGIHCSCCSRILTVSTFEIHAGSKLCQPYQNIFLEDAGISLLQCQLNAWGKQDESVRQSFYSIDTDGDDPNDDTCGICGDGGDLICCDSCPSTFHLSCLGMEMLPPGDWNCMNCSCRFCGLVSSSDAQEHGAAISPLCFCYQCGKKYHFECIPDRDASLNFPCISYCGRNCKKLFGQLQRLLGVKNDLEAGFSWTLLQRLDEDLPESVCAVDQRVECNSKIAVALSVMDECFVPIIDQRSGINLIHNVVYNCGSNFSRLNYRGFYTIVLEREDEIISAASIRIHGTKLAEMPFIGTRNMYRRQGMCRRLLSGIESALCSLDIGKLIIPAISELTDTWTNVFGFKPIESSEKQEVRSINMLVFPGTGLLAKWLLKHDSNEHSQTTDRVGNVKPDSTHHHIAELPNESSTCSFISLELNPSDEIIIQSGQEVKDIKPCASEVLPGSSDASQGCKSSETLMPPEVVYHGQLGFDKEFQVNSSSKAKSEFPNEDSVHGNSIVKAKDVSVVTNLLLDGTSENHTSDTKCISPDAIAATFHYSGAKDATDLPAVSSMSMPQDAIASTLQESGGNDPYVTGCSQALGSHATHFDESKTTSNSSLVILVEHSFKISTEHIVINNHKIQHEVNTQPSFGQHAGNGNSEIFGGPLVALTKSLTPIEPNIDSVDCEIHSVQKLKVHPSPARPEPFANNGYAERCGPEVSTTRLEIVPGKQSQNKCLSASCNTDIISLHTYPVQSEERFMQCTSELQQKPRESCCTASLPFATDDLQCNKHDSVNFMNGTSLSKHTVPLGEDNMCNFHEAKNDAGYVENHLCDLGKSSSNTLDIDLMSVECYAPTPDGSNHDKHMVAKGPSLLYPGGTDSSASTHGVGNQSLRFENCPVAGSRCATVNAPEVNAGEGINELKVVVPD